MPPDNNTEAPPEGGVGVKIMADLISNLVIANENAKATQQMLADLIEVEGEKVKLLDDLNGHLEALSMAADEVAELSQDKGKITMADFCQALAKAEAEVFAEEPGGPE